MPAQVRSMTVLYDGSCDLCVRCAGWLSRQPAFVPVVLVPAGSERAHKLFPALHPVGGSGAAEELVVVDDAGGVYRGDAAWLMCLWALRDYREWAIRQSSPSMRPLARSAFQSLSARRHGLSRLIWREEAVGEPACAGHHPRCASPAPDARRSEVGIADEGGKA